jgi:hypothetical protein
MALVVLIVVVVALAAAWLVLPRKARAWGACASSDVAPKSDDPTRCASSVGPPRLLHQEGGYEPGNWEQDDADPEGPMSYDVESGPLDARWVANRGSHPDRHGDAQQQEGHVRKPGASPMCDIVEERLDQKADQHGAQAQGESLRLTHRGHGCHSS